MNKNIGVLLLNISVALYLLATGIIGFSKGSGGDIGAGVVAIFGTGSIASIFVIILSICAIAAGVFILLKFFGVSVAITELLLLVLAIAWVVFIVLRDIIAPLRWGGFGWAWLAGLGTHVMVLSAMLLSTKRFGK